MKDFAKSVRTNNADLGLRPVVPQLVKDIAKIYEDNGKDREKTKQELIQKHHMSERQAEDVLRQIVGNSKVGNDNWGRARDAQGWYETYTDAVKEGDQNKIERYKNKLKDRLHDMELKRKDILEDLKDTEEAIKIYKKVGNSKVGNYMMDPKGDVESLIRLADKYQSDGDTDGAKRLWGSMEIVFRQLKSDKEEHYKKYQEADDLLGKLNKAAGKLKSIL